MATNKVLIFMAGMEVEHIIGETKEAKAQKTELEAV